MTTKNGFTSSTGHSDLNKQKALWTQIDGEVIPVQCILVHHAIRGDLWVPIGGHLATPTSGLKLNKDVWERQDGAAGAALLFLTKKLAEYETKLKKLTTRHS